MLANFLTACWAKSHKNYKEGLGMGWATRSYSSSGNLQAIQARRDRHWLPWARNPIADMVTQARQE